MTAEKPINHSGLTPGVDFDMEAAGTRLRLPRDAWDDPTLQELVSFIVRVDELQQDLFAAVGTYIDAPLPGFLNGTHPLATRYATLEQLLRISAALLREDATWSVPQYALRLRGHLDIRRFCLGPGIGCRGSVLVPTMANGAPAFAQYKPAADGGHEAWALQTIELSERGISGVTFFLGTARLFLLFNLPLRLDRRDAG